MLYMINVDYNYQHIFFSESFKSVDNISVKIIPNQTTTRVDIESNERTAPI